MFEGHVEVSPMPGKRLWEVWVHDYNTHGKTFISAHQLKRVAKLVARGLAIWLHVERKVKNRKGQYTKESDSFGNDPKGRG